MTEQASAAATLITFERQLRTIDRLANDFVIDRTMAIEGRDLIAPSLSDQANIRKAYLQGLGLLATTQKHAEEWSSHD